MAKGKGGKNGGRKGQPQQAAPPPAAGLVVSDYDAEMVRSQASLRAAVVAGMDPGLMAVNEIQESVRAVAPELGIALDQFLSTFAAWHTFHKRVADHPGNLTNDEKTELFALIRAKEEARARFAALMELPTPEIARSWVQDALEPVAERLALEITRLAARQWAWRFHMEQSELIVPLSNYAAPILRSRSYITAEFRRLVVEHDRALAELLNRLREASNALLQDQTFVTRVEALLAQHLERHQTDRPFGAFPRERMPALAAQFVLNHVEEVATGSSTMELFWNENRAAIQPLVAEARLAPVRAAGAALLEVARQLQPVTQALIDRVSRVGGIVVAPRSSTWVPERF